MAWWPDDGLQEWLNHAGEPVGGILPRSVWPVKIRGKLAVLDYKSTLFEWHKTMIAYNPVIYKGKVLTCGIGQEIATSEGITDLAIGSSPAMTIWAFCKDGIAKVWKLSNDTSESLQIGL